jgi:hypothetical protein
LNSLVPTRQRRPWGLLALGCGLLGVIAVAANLGEHSLQAGGIPHLDFLYGLQGVQLCGTDDCSAELSLKVVEFWDPIST